MSRGLKIVFVLSCCFLWEAQAFSQVRVRFDATFGQEEIRIGFREQAYKVKLDESGVGRITIPDSLAPGYAALYGPRNVYSFYLVPGQQQEITKLNGQEIKFTGAAKAINIYLNSPFLNNRDPGYEKGEEEFLKEWALMPGRLQAHLDSLPLPADFKKSERKRLYYVACHSLLDYPLLHARLLRLKSYSPGERYYRKVSELLQEDPSAHEFWEYRQFFRNGIQLLGEKKKTETGKPLDKLKCELDYICNHIKDEELASYLVDESMSGYIRYFGTEGMEAFLPLYREKVKDEKQKAAFFRSYEQYTRLEKGRKAPHFSLLDKDGNRKNLSDWLGNYVYIDVWATWCGPCCRELPAFHKLKEEFKDKPICFVSISIDADEAAWRAKIEKDSLDGIQLRVNEEDTFKKDAEAGPQTIAYYKQLKKKWKVSIAAMIRRAEKLNIITKEEYQALIRIMQRRGQRKEEPLDDVLITAAPALLKASVMMLLQENVFTAKEFMDELSNEYKLSISPEEVEYLLDLPVGTLAVSKIIDFNAIQIKRSK